MTNQLLDEYRARVANVVKRGTCDLDLVTDEYIAGLDVEGLRLLVKVLRGEITQLRDAVLQVK